MLGPVPDDAVETVSQGMSVAAVHVQLASVVIVAEKLPPAMHASTWTGTTEYWHPPLSPAWITSKTELAAAICPVRESVVTFREAVQETTPGPVCSAAPATCSQASPVLAVQRQLAPVVTM